MKTNGPPGAPIDDLLESERRQALRHKALTSSRIPITEVKIISFGNVGSNLWSRGQIQSLIRFNRWLELSTVCWRFLGPPLIHCFVILCLVCHGISFTIQEIETKIKKSRKKKLRTNASSAVCFQRFDSQFLGVNLLMRLAFKLLFTSWSRFSAGLG